MKKELTKQMLKIRDNYDEKKQEEILKEINDLIMKQNFSERTITVYFSQTKNLFKQTISNDTFLKKIRPADDITNKVLKENNIKRNERTMKTIRQGMIEQIISFSDSYNASKLLIYLMLVSGRRIGEVINGKFYLKKNEKNIMFKGILKKKEDKNTEYKILLLTTKSKFIKSYKKFKLLTYNRKLLSLNQTTNAKIKELFGDEYSSHTMRGIYANYLFKFHNTQKLTINPFLQMVLKHDVVETSLNYTHYDFDFNEKLKF